MRPLERRTAPRLAERVGPSTTGPVRHNAQAPCLTLSNMAPRQVVVDGSNIATEGRSTPSLAQLDQAVREFLVEYPDAIVTVVVDASFAHRIDASESDVYEE